MLIACCHARRHVYGLYKSYVTRDIVTEKMLALVCYAP